MRGEASMYLSNLVCSRNKDDFLKFTLEYLTYEKEWVETFGKKPFQRLLSTNRLFEHTLKILIQGG